MTLTQIKDICCFAVDSKGGRILELNDSVRASVDPLHKTHDGNVYTNAVIPYLKSLQPDLLVRYAPDFYGLTSGAWESMAEHFGENPRSSTRHFVFPSYSGRGGTNYDTVRHNQSYPDFFILNGKFWPMMLFNKDYLTHLAQDAKVSAIPETRNYERPVLTPSLYKADVDRLVDQIMQDFSHKKTLVLKPTNADQGKGVVIFSRQETRDVFYDVFGINDTRISRPVADPFARKYWERFPAGHIQVQEFIEGSAVTHKGQDWDATDRTLWTVATGKDALGFDALDVMCHGGFHKLPRRPQQPGKGTEQHNSISYSYAHSPADWLRHQFTSLGFSGSGDQLLMDADTLKERAAPINRALYNLFYYMEFVPDAKIARNLGQHHGDVGKCQERSAQKILRFGPAPEIPVPGTSPSFEREPIL